MTIQKKQKESQQTDKVSKSQLQTCCKAHAKINRKIGNSSLSKTVTPKNFSSILCTRDYVGDGNYGPVGASSQVGKI